MGVLLPVAPVKLNDLQLQAFGIQAVGIDVDTVWIRARNIERLDTADPAESMLRNTGVKSIGDKAVLTAEQAESGGWHNQVQIPAHAADGTVAVLQLQRWITHLNFQFHRLTMATALKNSRHFYPLGQPLAGGAGLACRQYPPTGRRLSLGHTQHINKNCNAGQPRQRP